MAISDANRLDDKILTTNFPYNFFSLTVRPACGVLGYQYQYPTPVYTLILKLLLYEFHNYSMTFSNF